MQNTDNMGNWTYPSDEKMKEIVDLLNNEMTFNLGIKMFLGEFSMFTYDSTTSTGAMYFKYSDEFKSTIRRLLSDWNKYHVTGDKFNSYGFEIEHSIRPNLFYIFKSYYTYGGTSRVNNKS
jgi:hypothetical protein